jgi:hypothetical protein
MIVAFATAGQAQAESTTVVCTAAETVIDLTLKAGKLANRKEVIDSLEEARLYTIELTFDPEKAPGGIGTVRGKTMPYWVTDDFVVYMTAGAGGPWEKNSFLDRRKATFGLALDATAQFPYENCTIQPRKF